jgi:hypothetical protein
VTSYANEIIDAKAKNTKKNITTLYLAIVCICEMVNTYLKSKHCIYTHKKVNINENRFNALKKIL